MSRDMLIFLLAATLLWAVGLWLMLPRGDRRGYVVGAVLTLAGLGMFASQAMRLSGGFASDTVFVALAALTIFSAIGAVTLRSPVYCAIWFALMLIGVAGLFLYQGAQFLGVATIVVYAGAILVTFLFVLLLANPEGHAYYDRVSWEPFMSAAAGAVLLGMLTTAFINALGSSAAATPTRVTAAPVHATDPERGVLAQEHVARIGANLFSTHLIAVEVAGVLLMVALVGAVAIAAHGQPPRRGATHG